MVTPMPSPCLVFADGKHLASGTIHGEAKIWDINRINKPVSSDRWISI